MSNNGNNGPEASGTLSVAEREALSKRASDIGAKIEAAKHRRDLPGQANRGDIQGNSQGSSQGNPQASAMGRGMKVSAELIGGVVAGGGIGWVLDKWLNTFPALFIVFFLLGSAAGILNIVRQAQRETTPLAPSVKDDEDDDK